MTVKISLLNKSPATEKADALVVIVDGPLTENSIVDSWETTLGGGLQAHLEAIQFKPEKGGVASIPVLGNQAVGRLVFAGVRQAEGGDGASFGQEARLAAAVASGVRACLPFKPKKINVAVDRELDLRAVAQGSHLGAYKFDKYFTGDKSKTELKQIQVLREKTPNAGDKKAFALGLKVAEGVCMARDLVNEPPNVLIPEEFARRARLVAKKNKLSCKILDHKGIVKAKMHLHHAVGKGSENLPYFIHLIYKPARPQGKVAFVGKGITFDSGGLCIKPGGSMLDMKTDMSGAGAVLGMMEAVSALGLNVEVHGIIAAAENMPDAKAYRPSDVLDSLSGKGVEVINTDAEGRLVLADALTYAARLQPDFIVDAATLTGATLVSLGAPFSAFYTGSQEIASAMKEASASAGESFWQMPLIEELAVQLKSNITDLKHTGDRMGGAITAALFLREFTEGVPWMHCDIPGPVFRDRASGMNPKGATGHAVLTFLGLIQQHALAPIVQNKAKSKTKSKAASTSTQGAKKSNKTKKKSKRAS